MPHPVLPPETPAIVETISDSSHAIATAPVAAKVELAEVAHPTPPETFAPESSRAAALGSRISVGTPQERETVVLPTPNESEGRNTAKQEEQTAVFHTQRESEGRNTAKQEEQTTLPNINSAQSSLVIPQLSSSTGISRLVTQERGGEVKEFEFVVPTPETQPEPNPTNLSDAPISRPHAVRSKPAAAPTETPLEVGGAIELTADRQEYDVERRVVTAEGKVLFRFQQSVLDADRVEINIPNRILVAQGNVVLTRGDQVLRGSRFEYSFVSDSGNVLGASGELYVPAAGTDFAPPLPTDINAATAPVRPLSDRILENQPLQRITTNEGYQFVVGTGRSIGNLVAPGTQTGGTINRLRYQAERVDFEGGVAVARNVRITNDPFSPPELEIRADTATFRRVAPLVDEIVTTRSRIVFDQGLEIPTFRNRFVLDRRDREPGLVNFGYDDEDRGGLFAERGFEILNTPSVSFRVAPQYYIQRAIFEEGPFDPSVFGVRSRLNAVISPTTTFRGSLSLTSLDFGEIEDNLRASARLQQQFNLFQLPQPHTLSLEASYRDRLFNGSLGFQTVQSSIGAVFASPNIVLGNTGINLSYQAGIQRINADTDDIRLLKPDRTNNRITLTRYQGSLSLSRGFTLWEGKALPATPTEGLRYTPVPVVPYLSLGTGVTGTTSIYSNGDTQESLSSSIGLSGQIGHFSKPFLDYTGFNVTYSQSLRGNLSPFLFDRIVDEKVLSAGITQQVYGPFRVGFQTSINLDTGQEISTDYFVEYSRRTYNVILRYNPVLQVGSFNLRISDFNWIGSPGPFAGTDIRPVVQGVTRD